MSVSLISDFRDITTASWRKSPVVAKVVYGDYYVYVQSDNFYSWIHTVNCNYRTRKQPFSIVPVDENNDPIFSVWVFDHNVDAMQFSTKLKYEARDDAFCLNSNKSIVPILTKTKICADLRLDQQTDIRNATAVVKVTCGDFYQFVYAKKYSTLNTNVVGVLRQGRDFKKLSCHIQSNRTTYLDVYLFNNKSTAQDFLKSMILDFATDKYCCNKMHTSLAMRKPAWYTLYIGDKFYHGCTGNLYRRMFCHTNELKYGKHHSSALQQHYNNLGVVPTFTYMFTDSKEEALELERRAVKQDINDSNCLNVYIDVNRGNTK